MSLNLNPEDLFISIYEVDFKKGFHRYSDSGIAIYHKPSGLLVREQASRDAMLNRAVAMRRLSEAVEQKQKADYLSQEALKKLRMWHWRKLKACRKREAVYTRRANEAKPGGATEKANRSLAKQKWNEGNFHLSAVQALNSFLPGTAEQDCFADDHAPK